MHFSGQAISFSSTGSTIYNAQHFILLQRFLYLFFLPLFYFFYLYFFYLVRVSDSRDLDSFSRENFEAAYDALLIRNDLARYRTVGSCMRGCE